MTRFVEIRSYNLKAGTRDAFDRLMHTQSLPMLRQWQVDVVACGRSPHDEDSYFLMRAYASISERQRSQDDFYGSAQWREGPRQSIVDCIDSYTSIVVELDEATIDRLRRV